MSGIETLKKNLGTILTIIKKTDEALEDNKLSIVEAFGIGLTGLKAWGIWKEYTAMKEEYLDLDDLEIEELHAYFVAEFDIKNDSIEEIIETIFLFILNMKTIAEGLK